MKKNPPAEIAPIEIMRFMDGWNCEDYNSAPAKFIANVSLLKKALETSRNQPQLPPAVTGPPEAWKRIMAKMRGGGG